MSEFRLQIYFAALHTLVIIAGSLIAPVMSGDTNSFVSNYGFLLLLIPLSWALITLRLEINHTDWFSKRWTFVSGLLLLGWLYHFFFQIGSKGLMSPSYFAN